jgi:hypothetical protein
MGDSFIMTVLYGGTSHCGPYFTDFERAYCHCLQKDSYFLFLQPPRILLMMSRELLKASTNYPLYTILCNFHESICYIHLEEEDIGA